MNVKSKSFKQINRQYLISSGELKKAMNIEGEIIEITNHYGRSPNEIEEGKSPDTDLWSIRTEEKIKVKK